MKKYILYAHDGSGNHGCEALVRSTAALLGAGRDRTTLVSLRPEEDWHYGVHSLCQVVRRGTMGAVPKASFSFLKAYLQLKCWDNFKPLDQLSELAGAGAKAGDVALSIGGDTYCYGATRHLAESHALWKSGKIKTVYWGCSIEPELLENPDIAADIKAYDLITARETISYHALKEVNPNTILVSDSAFCLNSVEKELPPGFENAEFVGLNVSPLAEISGLPGMVRKNFVRLIEKILSETTMNILLIPHVIWAHDDDRIVLNDLYRRFADTGRIAMVEDDSCQVLKGYIARCRFFVGARTHASIAAYSSGVPTLVLGYSVKSRGIARDLFGTEQNYVLSAQTIKEEDDLSKQFAWLMDHELEIRDHLKNVIPEYRSRVLRGRDAVISL